MQKHDYNELMIRVLGEDVREDVLQDLLFKLDEHQGAEIRTLRAASRLLNDCEAALEQDMHFRAEQLNQQIILELKQLQMAAEQDTKRNRMGLFAAIKQLREDLAGWAIGFFGMLPARDEVVFGSREKIPYKEVFSGSGALVLVMLAVLAPIVIFLAAPGGTDHLQTENHSMYGSEISDAAPRLVNYSKEVRMAMAPHSSIGIISSTRLQMQRGNVWLDVEKGGQGFEVQTDLGLVKVTGTQFGVEQNAAGLQVTVLEGSVEFDSGKWGEYDIPAGRMLVLAEGMPPREKEMIDRAVPEWLKQMQRDEGNVFLVGRDALQHRFDFKDGQFDDTGFGDPLELALKGKEGQPEPEFVPVVTDVNGHERKDVLRHTRTNGGNLNLQSEDLGYYSGPYTISLWVRTEDLMQPVRAAALSLSEETYKWTQVRASKGFYSLLVRYREGEDVITGDGSNILLGKSPIAAGAWAHLVVSWDGKVVRFYHDGELIVAQAIETFPRINRIKIGESVIVGTQFEGDIDDVRFYDRPLQDWEVKLLSQQ